MRESPDQHPCASVIAEIDDALALVADLRPTSDIPPTVPGRPAADRREQLRKTRAHWAELEPVIEALHEARELALANDADGLIALSQRARSLGDRAVGVERLSLKAAMKLGNHEGRTRLIAMGAVRFNERAYDEAMALFFMAECREGLQKILDATKSRSREDIGTAVRVRQLMEQLPPDEH